MSVPFRANVQGPRCKAPGRLTRDGPRPTLTPRDRCPGSLDGTGPVLAGAAVEGPNGGATTGSLSGMRACPANGVDAYAAFNGKTAQFKDNVQSYSNTEPAIDLTATSPLAFARQAAGIR